MMIANDGPLRLFIALLPKPVIQIRDRVQIERLFPSLMTIIDPPGTRKNRLDGIVKMRRLTPGVASIPYGPNYTTMRDWR